VPTPVERREAQRSCDLIYANRSDVNANQQTVKSASRRCDGRNPAQRPPASRIRPTESANHSRTSNDIARHLTIDDRPSLIPELTKNANGNATPDHIVVMLENRSFDPVIGRAPNRRHRRSTPVDQFDEPAGSDDGSRPPLMRPMCFRLTQATLSLTRTCRCTSTSADRRQRHLVGRPIKASSTNAGEAGTGRHTSMPVSALQMSLVQGGTIASINRRRSRHRAR
jgi:hypothetical protein